MSRFSRTSFEPETARFVSCCLTVAAKRIDWLELFELIVGAASAEDDRAGVGRLKMVAASGVLVASAGSSGDGACKG